jgi:hypothetical protein
MKKRFNTTGSCNPAQHYMVDTSRKLAQIEEYIEEGSYFTINRARQFGKTTTMDSLFRLLSDKYFMIKISFEGLGEDDYREGRPFLAEFQKILVKKIKTVSPELADFWKTPALSFGDLSQKVYDFCKLVNKPVVLMIDEVDKSQNNQLFLDLLGMLRNLYLERSESGDMNSTFHSVVLAGVYDVKNLKIKLRPDEERKYNSPWNIAAKFNVDMTFHPNEIITMLDEYEADYHTGMDKAFIANEIYKYTSGYPYLVSCICYIIDKELEKDWSEKGIQDAIKILIKDRENTLLGDLTKNVETYPDFEKLMTDVLLHDKEIVYEPNVPAIDLALTFSAVKEDAHGHITVHNLVFEQKLYNYFVAKESLKGNADFSGNRSIYVTNGRLNMPLVIARFQELMRNERRKADNKFLERQGRLLFLCFLKPIVNGTGFYYVEPETRDGGRMDLVVSFGGEEFVIELKIWRGEKYEVEGKVQLAEYLKTRNLSEGYLVTFSFLKNKTVQEEPEWVEHDGKRIYEAVI